MAWMQGIWPDRNDWLNRTIRRATWSAYAEWHAGHNVVQRQAIRVTD
jgi:hypothetical protein